MHLFVARWPASTGHQGWRSHSEIVHYVGEHPEGPFTFSEVALKGTGEDTWDKYAMHNPAIHQVGVTSSHKIGQDFTYYWFHRISHRVRIFWACHVVHHSSEDYNYSTALRNGWFSIFYKPLFWIWMAVVGFHPLMIITCLSINTLYQFFCHTTVGFTWTALGTFFSNPQLHEVHHGSATQHHDKNFGGIFIIFDRIFGTYHPPCDERVVYGVTHPPESDHVLEVVFHEMSYIYHEMKESNDWKTRIKLLVKPPGWSIPFKK